MTTEQMEREYNRLMFTGAQTLEKHIRHAAEQIIEDVEGGFEVKGPHDKVFEVPFHASHGYRTVRVVVPPGMHGFALQMLVEEQLREALI